MRVTVVGAGIIGMTSALAVKTNFPQFEVHVVSDEFSPATTADGSAGLWTPYLLGNTPSDKILQWSGITHRWLENFWKAGLAPEIGLSLIPVYRVTSDPNGFPDVSTWVKTVYGARKLSSSELEKLNAECTTGYKHGWMFLTYTVEPVRLLPWLTKRFLEAGGELRNRKIRTLNELIDDDGYDLIINCTGLGARELAGDNTVKCIRGQVARVRAPWVMHVYLADDGNYIIPNTDTVVLGGTHQENDFDRTPRKEDCEFIYNGCRRILPSLKNAEVTKDWVGLRPGRHQVRIEAEVCKSAKGREVTVIHNYGHGGSGVTLSWGSAMNVVNIVGNVTNLKSNL